MNCRTCNYPLWDLKSRSCPECNTPFAPSTYTFRRNSVAFCCPNCDQPYYGTGEGGHLDPPQFACVKCHQPLHEDIMVLRPTSGVDEERTRFRPIPWLDTEIRSTLGRLVRTGMWALFSPSQLGARLPSPERPGSAIGFLVASVLLMMLPGIVLVVIIGAMMPGPMFGPGSLAFGLIFCVVVWALVALVPWALVAHFVIAASGPRRAGFWRTFACLAYGVPACLPLAVPGLGMYLVPVSLIWWTVVSTLIMRRGQGVSGLRAFAATGLFPLLIVLTIGGVVMFLIVPAVQKGMAAVSAQTTPTQQATALSAPILAHAAANGGEGPAHMSELLLQKTIKAIDLQSGMQFRNDARTMIGAQNLFTLEFAGEPQKAIVRSAVKAATPAGTITAHRLGDVVFTYHGINLSTPPDPGLWMFVITSEPSPFAFRTSVATPGGTASTPMKPPLAIAKVDGTIVEVADANFAAELDAQNALRAKLGLSGLPDPRKMLANGFATPADAPAVAPPVAPDR